MTTHYGATAPDPERDDKAGETAPTPEPARPRLRVLIGKLGPWVESTPVASR